MSDPSPQKPTNTVTFAYKTANSTKDTRESLARDLAGKEVLDAPVLDHYLKAKSLPIAWVSQCRQYLSNNRGVQEAVKALKTLQAEHRGLSVDPFTVKKGRKELEMYPPLLHILNTIAAYSQASRVFRDSHKMDANQFEDGFPGFSPVQPDLIMEAGDSKPPKRKLLWRNVLCCIEVKFEANAGPLRERSVPTNADNRVKESVAQAADYARMHMSCRPFQVFSVNVTIFASHFTVSIYDRGGVMHSPQMDVYDDHGVTDDFIRAVRLLSRDLTEQDLGLDPTVTIVPSADSTHPTTFNVGFSPPTANAERWNTLGHPIWTSYSLLGRGTTVWRANADVNARSACILKTAWRHEDRSGEAEVYKFMKERKIAGTRGIAVFRSGQDILKVSVGEAGRQSVLSVNSLRPPKAMLAKDIILHRVVLDSVGKPLWEYDDPAHFIRALLAIVEGIRTLQKHDIVHRDISAGNVLLSTDPRPGYEAFLTDFELAKIPPQPKVVRTDTTKPVEVIQMPKERNVPVTATNSRSTFHEEITHTQGPEITGTLQFMSIERLDNCIEYGPSGYPPTHISITHATHHDLESLVWVTEYSLFRRAYHSVQNRSQNDPGRKHVEEAFRMEFGCISARAIRDRRSATAISATSSFLPGMRPYFDEKLDILVEVMQFMVALQNPVMARKEHQHFFSGLVDLSGQVTQPKTLMTCDVFENMLTRYASSKGISL